MSKPRRMAIWKLWLVSWCNILDGVIGVLSLGLLRPSVSYRVIIYFAWKDAKRLAGKGSK